MEGHRVDELSAQCADDGPFRRRPRRLSPLCFGAGFAYCGDVEDAQSLSARLAGISLLCAYLCTHRNRLRDRLLFRYQSVLYLYPRSTVADADENAPGDQACRFDAGSLASMSMPLTSKTYSLSQVHSIARQGDAIRLNHEICKACLDEVNIDFKGKTVLDVACGHENPFFKDRLTNKKK